jgi:multidrug efflux system outer membrane protein
MSYKSHKQIAIMLLVAVTFASCKVMKKYQHPEIVAENLYRDTLFTHSDSTSMADLPWKALFSDTTLQALIQEGLDKNLNLKTAMLRMSEAQYTLQQSKLVYLPTLDAGISANPSRNSRAALNFPEGININLKTITYKAQLSASWEINLWGQLSSLKRQALANFLQSDAAKRAIQTQLIADIANYYYNLIALDEQLAITESTVENRIEGIETMKALKASAVVNGAAVVQSEANRYAVEVTIPDLKRNIREIENLISILLARTPGAIQREKLSVQKPFVDIDAGVSTLLFRNRPDVQEAEFAFKVAFENTNVAYSYFYPSLSITAQGGLSTLRMENFFDKSIFYSVIGGLTQPIFNRGQNKTRYKIAQAQQQEALLGFQQTMLNAGQEVSNALYVYQTALDKQQTRAKQIESLEKAVEYTKELLRYSSATNYTDVLTSEQSLLAAQLNSVNDQLQQYQTIVNLYRALGGGWK